MEPVITAEFKMPLMQLKTVTPLLSRKDDIKAPAT
jgi:hypothetical protein